MAQYFNTNLDSASIRSDLLSHDHDRQLGAVKQVVAHMVLGKDMSSHYNDVANLLSSTDLQMKKLVYLYLMQNSKYQPEKAVLQAGTFVHDTNHASPLIRGIALRTMSSMLVPAMVDFLHPPVMARLRDHDPYVRRNAAFACLKLFTIAPDVCKQVKLLEALDELLTSPVPSVVAAAVCVISEIVSKPNAPASLQTAVASHALSYVAALEGCGEWSQLYLLEGIAQLFQHNSAPIITLEEAETVVTRVIPQLQSMNVAVATAAVKVIISMVQQFTGPSAGLAEDIATTLECKYIEFIVPPMLTLVCTTKDEIRYIALRNLKLLLNAGPNYVTAFVPHLSNLYVKYDDPIYIKLEKIDAMLALSTDANAKSVLTELAEYATEADDELIRKAVRSIGTLAVSVEGIAEACIACLVGIIDRSDTYGVAATSEAACVFQTVLRQYPTRFTDVLAAFPLEMPDAKGNVVLSHVDVIAKLCDTLPSIHDDDSRGAIIWVVGEYAKGNASEVLSLFTESFKKEPTVVQLAVLTAITKTYLKGVENVPGANLSALNEVLELCKTSEVPDVRDRAFFYWRLISADRDSAARVLLAHKAGLIVTDTIERQLLAELMSQVGHISSVHQSASAFLGEVAKATFSEEANADLFLMTPQKPSNSSGFGAESTEFLPEISLLSPGKPGAVAEQKVLSSVSWEQVLESRGAGKGITVHVGWSHGTKGPQLHTRMVLDGSASPSTTVKVVTMQINVNAFGIGITQPFPETVLRAGDAPTIVSLSVGANNQRKPVMDMQVALKVDPIGVLFFVAPPIPMHLVLQPATGYDPSRYAAEFEEAQVGWQLPPDFPPIYTSPSRLNTNSLRLLCLNLVHSKESGNVIGAHIYASTIAGQRIYAAISTEGGRIATVTVKSNEPFVCTAFGEYLLASVAV